MCATFSRPRFPLLCLGADRNDTKLPINRRSATVGTTNSIQYHVLPATGNGSSLSESPTSWPARKLWCLIFRMEDEKKPQKKLPVTKQQRRRLNRSRHHASRAGWVLPHTDGQRDLLEPELWFQWQWHNGKWGFRGTCVWWSFPYRGLTKHVARGVPEPLG